MPPQTNNQPHPSSSGGDEIAYKASCSEPDCFNTVDETDIERDKNGRIYERSKKCWDCRTVLDRRAIKKFRKKHA